MLSIDARLTLIALAAAAARVRVSVRYFDAAIHKRFEGIQEQLADLSAVVQGGAVRRARSARLPPGGARDRALSRRQPRISSAIIAAPDPPPGPVLPEHDAVPGLRLAPGPVAG